jgi:hypothetical protein
VKPENASFGESIHQLNRSASLLIAAELSRGHIEVLEAAVAALPKVGPLEPSDEKLVLETDLLEAYIDDVAANLRNTQWADGLRLGSHRWTQNADADLKASQPPTEVNPYNYRLHYIARYKRDHISEFLDRALREAKESRRDILGVLGPRRSLHEN